MFFKETLRDRAGSGVWIGVPNRPPDQNASPAFGCSDSLQLSSVDVAKLHNRYQHEFWVQEGFFFFGAERPDHASVFISSVCLGL